MADGSAVVRPHNDVDQQGWTLWYYSPSTGLDYNLQGGEPTGGGGPDAHGALGLRSRKWEYKVGSRVLLGAWRGSREVTVDVECESDAAFDAFMEATDADAANQVPGEIHALGYVRLPGSNSHFPKEWVHTVLVVSSESQSHHMRRGNTIRLTFLYVDGGWRTTLSTAQFTVSHHHHKRLEGLDMGVDLASPETKNQKPFPKVEPTGITVTGLPSMVDMHTTTSVQLTASVQPDDVDDDGVTWNVAGPATVDGSGKLVFTGEGSVSVTATSTAKPSVKATVGPCTVYDSTKTVVPTGVTVSGLPATVSLAVDAESKPVAQSFNLTATFSPANVSNKGVSWSISVTADGNTVAASDVASYATVTDSGVLTVFKACNITVTATSTFNNMVKGSASTVASITYPAPTSITVMGVPDTVDADDTHSFTATPTITPSNADPRISWTVDGPARVEVEDN